MYVDVASNARGSGVGIFMVSPKGLRVEKSLRLGFCASTNEAEYEALVAGLRAVQNLSAKEAVVYSDSRLVVSQKEGSFEAKDCRMLQYLKLLQLLRSSFRKVSVARVPKSQNSHADSLATLALSSDESIPQMIFVELLEQLSIERQTVVGVISLETPSWMDPYVTFI